MCFLFLYIVTQIKIVSLQRCINYKIVENFQENYCRLCYLKKINVPILLFIKSSFNLLVNKCFT